MCSQCNRRVNYHGKEYEVIGEAKSIGNGSEELILRGPKGPVVVLASRCREVE